MNFRRTRAMFQKELRHIMRDVRSLIMALAMPVFMLLLFGFAVSLDVDRIPTYVYDADQSATSRELVQRFKASRFFEFKAYVNNYASIEKAIDRGDILVGLVVPRDYSANIRADRKADVQILLDGSDSNTAAIALGYAETLVRNYSLELRSRAQNRNNGGRLLIPIDARMRVWYNSTLESKNYVVPGLISVILMIIAALLTSLTVAREWEMGTMEQLLSTPVRPAEIVMGKMLAFFVIGALDTAISVLVGIYIFEVPFRGSPLLLAGTSCIFLAGAFFWGIFLSAVAKQQLLAYQMGIISSFLPAMMLSGFVYAIENMPAPIRAITYLVPARYFVSASKGIFLKGVGLEVLVVEIGFLVIFATVIFLLATRKLSQKLA